MGTEEEMKESNPKSGPTSTPTVVGGEKSRLKILANGTKQSRIIELHVHPILLISKE